MRLSQNPAWMQAATPGGPQQGSAYPDTPSVSAVNQSSISARDAMPILTTLSCRSREHQSSPPCSWPRSQAPPALLAGLRCQADLLTPARDPATFCLGSLLHRQPLPAAHHPPRLPTCLPHPCGAPPPTQRPPALSPSLPAHRPWRSGRAQTQLGLLGRVPRGPPAHNHQGGAPTCSAATSSFVSTAASPALPCSAATWWKKRLHLVSTSENCSCEHQP